MTTGKLTILSSDLHRNGIGGAAFDVVRFDHASVTGKQRMVAVSFSRNDGNGGEHPYETAVLDVDLLARDNIRFGENSWRGDDFEDTLREMGALSAPHVPDEPQAYVTLTAAELAYLMSTAGSSAVAELLPDLRDKLLDAERAMKRRQPKAVAS